MSQWNLVPLINTHCNNYWSFQNIIPKVTIGNVNITMELPNLKLNIVFKANNRFGGFWTLKFACSTTLGITTPFLRVRANKQHTYFINQIQKKYSFSTIFFENLNLFN